MNAITDALGEPADATARVYLCTFGHYTQKVPWEDQRMLTWSDVVSILINHVVGPKEGSCFVPAVFRDGLRRKHSADAIAICVLDSDNGTTLTEIERAICACGLAAVISSTHSHLITRVTVGRGAWDAFCARQEDQTSSESLAAAYLLEKGYRPNVVAAASVMEIKGDEVILRHNPCPKFRIAFPLVRPWRAADYPDQERANAAWRAGVEALAAALGLDHDEACTDTSRLFFLPRCPADGPAPETAVLDGEACDIFTLPQSEESLFGTSTPELRRRSQPSVPDDDTAFVDTVTGETIDLGAWVCKFGARFQIVDALRARQPDLFTGRVADRIKHHLRCPNAEAHSQAGIDGATFVTNASEARNRGFVIHCRHAHCGGLDRLVLLRRMLEKGWLTRPDLTEPGFLAEVGDTDLGATASADSEPERRRLTIGSDAEIARRVADDLLRRLGPVIQDEGAFWSHNGMHWEAIPVEDLWKSAFIYDGALFLGSKGDTQNVKLGKGRVESILACMMPMLRHRRFFADAPLGINCTSGFITFLSDGTPEIAPHNLGHRQRHVIAGRWPCHLTFETRKASLLHRLLDGCFKDDPDKAAKFDLLGEIAGVAARGSATRHVAPKALVCVGKQAENGKSQVLAMLRSLLPERAVSAISPAKFDDRTFACHLVGKLLNAPDELGSTEAITSEIFKQIITGEPITVRDVYRSAFEFAPVAQHVYATNNLPTFKGGMDRGVRRRLMVLSFNRVIPREERVDHIGQRIGAVEADLLLDWAVRGAGRVIRTGTFTTPPSSAEALQDWMFSSDPVLAWLESEDVEFTTGASIPQTRVSIAHDKFVRWACEEGFGYDRLPAVNGFSQRVEAAGKGITKKRTSEGAHFVGLACLGAGSGRRSGCRRG